MIQDRCQGNGSELKRTKPQARNRDENRGQLTQNWAEHTFQGNKMEGEALLCLTELTSFAFYNGI